MPALTISTNSNANLSNRPRSRSSSPLRPPVSPLTPPLAATRLNDNAVPRQTYTHSQPDQIGVPPPAPIPLDFDSNPDVIALRSAISVLQVQRKRATQDIQTLSRAMEEAVEEPEAFVKDLIAGKTRGQPTGALPQRSAENEEDEEDEDEMEVEGGSASEGKIPQQPKAWNSLPKPQDVIRTPPINWAQYAVVGDSLEKLHTEQLSSPSQGTPASIGATGLYEYKGGDGTQEKYIGAAAPYTPSRDKVDRKPPRGKK